MTKNLGATNYAFSHFVFEAGGQMYFASLVEYFISRRPPQCFAVWHWLRGCPITTKFWLSVATTGLGKGTKLCYKNWSVLFTKSGGISSAEWLNIRIKPPNIKTDLATKTALEIPIN